MLLVRALGAVGAGSVVLARFVGMVLGVLTLRFRLLRGDGSRGRLCCAGVNHLGAHESEEQRDREQGSLL